jgi:perosamine synthetase
MGIKTHIAPMSAALGRVSLRKLPEFNRVRNQNHRWLSEQLERLGFDCFLPPPGIERVYFEFLVRHRDPAFDTARFLEILQDLGCQVRIPRYPLLHEQPFFRENHLARIGRYPADIRLPDYAQLEFPVTERENRRHDQTPELLPRRSRLTRIISRRVRARPRKIVMRRLFDSEKNCGKLAPSRKQKRTASSIGRASDS